LKKKKKKRKEKKVEKAALYEKSSLVLAGFPNLIKVS